MMKVVKVRLSVMAVGLLLVLGCAVWAAGIERSVTSVCDLPEAATANAHLVKCGGDFS